MVLNVWAVDDVGNALEAAWLPGGTPWPGGGGASPAGGAALGQAGADCLPIHHRRRLECVPVADVVYLKAELKYVTVRTAQRTYLYDGSLCELERRHPELWLRIHRNALVARRCLQALQRCPADEGVGGGWCVQLQGVPERLPVSRRLLATVRAAWADRA